MNLNISIYIIFYKYTILVMIHINKKMILKKCRIFFCNYLINLINKVKIFSVYIGVLLFILN